MLERIARLALGIDDHQIGAQLRQPLGQERVGRQHRDQVVAVFQQADAQRTRALGLLQCLRIVVSDAEVGCHDDNAQRFAHAGVPLCVALPGPAAASQAVAVRSTVSTVPGASRVARGAAAGASMSA